MLGKVEICFLVYVLCLWIFWQELQSYVGKTLLWKANHCTCGVQFLICYCGLCSKIQHT